MSERWLPVVGYEGRYEVSEQGAVRSLERLDQRGRRVAPRMLSASTQPSGHIAVKLSRDGVSVRSNIHRLVALAFLGPAPNHCEVLHGDGDPANNHLSNLRWGTRSENIRDSVRHGTHHWARKTHCPQHHPYDATNTYVTKDGRRMCRECLRQSVRRRRLQKKAA